MTNSERKRDSVGDDVLGDAVGEVLLLRVAATCWRRAAPRSTACRASDRSLARAGARPGCGRAATLRAHREGPHRIGMFFTGCSPWSSKLRGDLAAHRAATASDTVMPPGSASACSRAAMFTPSP